MAKTTTSATKVTAFENAVAEIEKARSSKLLVYMTGDRASENIPIDLSTQVAPDVIQLFGEILEEIQHTQKISLAIYTNGGMIETPWPLVNLIRDYCDCFEVIIIKKALSAGTLISLGADKIVMPKGSYLSPVDPSTTLPDVNNQPKKIEIENILGYIDFAKEKVGINDQATLGEILKELSKEISPSWIGSINRTHSLVRRLASKLLGLHVKQMPEHQSKVLVEHLTEKLFSHTHLISSREALEIGFEGLIELANGALEKNMKLIFEHYSNEMKLNEPLSAETLALSGPGQHEEVTTRALVHSSTLKHSFRNTLKYTVTDTPQGPHVNVTSFIARWEKQ